MKIFQRKRGKQNSKGSLLLESLLAIIILSLGIAFIVKSMSQSLRSLDSSTSYADVFILADNAMTQLMSDPKKIQQMSREMREFSYPLDAYAYRMDAQEVSFEYLQNTEEENKGDFYNLSYFIHWDKGKRKNVFQIDTLIYVTDEEN